MRTFDNLCVFDIYVFTAWRILQFQTVEIATFCFRVYRKLIT